MNRYKKLEFAGIEGTRNTTPFFLYIYIFNSMMFDTRPV